MKKLFHIYLSFLLVFFFVTNSSGQYDFNWAKTYGGDGEDKANSVVELANGDLLICGYKKTQEKHIWLMKVQPNGKSSFGKTYKQMPRSEANDLKIYKDSSIVMVGYCSDAFNPNSDFWILRVDKSGEKLWDKQFGDEENDESASSMTITSDSCIVAAGTKHVGFEDTDAWIIKVDEEGELIWDASLGETNLDYAHDIIETYDKELIMCGETQVTGSDIHSSLWVVKLGADGKEIWNKTYDIDLWNYGTSLMEASDSSAIYVAGYTRNKSLINRDIVLLKLDKDGEMIWSKKIDWGAWDEATTIHETYDNGIVVAGFSSSGNDKSSDFAVTKLDADSTVLWTEVFKRQSRDYVNKIIETRDNSLVLVGTSIEKGKSWDIAVLKYKNNDLSAIGFQQDSVSSTIQPIYPFNFCISAKNNLKNIQLYFNDNLYKDKISKHDASDSESDCNMPFKFDLKLKKGENTVEIVITDFKDHLVRRKCKIYFVPEVLENW